VPRSGRELVVIGRLGRPHGTGGELAAHATGPTLPGLAAGAQVLGRGGDGEVLPLRLAAHRPAGARHLLRFEGVETREAAAALTGLDLLVEAAELPPVTDPDTYYVRDLIGCSVMVGARAVGDVVEVHQRPANDVLEVATADETLFVPFTADAVVELDLPSRRLVVRPDLLPEG
jgi:16S rRNA processing protein RimM